MNLKDFETIIEDKIVSRGLSYYSGGSLEEIEEVDKNEFCGVVIGTDEYNVFIKLDKNNNIIEHSCDCPYDWGDYCKHEVAMLYWLKNYDRNSTPILSGKINKIKAGLQKMKKEELLEMMIRLSKRNQKIKEEIYWELEDE